MTWTNLYEKDGVTVGRLAPEHHGEDSAYYVVADEHFEQFRVTFYPSEDGLVSPGLDAQWSKDRPGELANYTSEIQAYCASDELSIDEAGLLTALARGLQRQVVDFRQGFTVRLPATFVPAIRLAIAAAFAEAKEKAARKAMADLRIGPIGTRYHEWLGSGPSTIDQARRFVSGELPEEATALIDNFSETLHLSESGNFTPEDLLRLATDRVALTRGTRGV